MAMDLQADDGSAAKQRWMKRAKGALFARVRPHYRPPESVDAMGMGVAKVRGQFAHQSTRLSRKRATNARLLDGYGDTMLRNGQGWPRA